MIAKRAFMALWILTVAILPSHRLSAERLAVHTYTVADGLAGDQVSCIFQDRQGFLWIGTRTGLSRFDGVSFRSFDTSDGLPHAGVHDIVEDSTGSLWFATGRGLVRMRTERNDQGSAFEPAIGIPGGVTALVEDEEGVLWASSSGTLYRRETQGGRSFVAVEVELPWLPDQHHFIGALLAADSGGLWLGTSVGLFRLQPNGAVVHHDVENGGPMWHIFALARDSAERIWVTGRGVVVFKPHEPHDDAAQTFDSSAGRFTFGATQKLPENPGEALRIDRVFEFTKHKVFGIDEGPDGSLWMASYGGLAILGPGGIVWHGRHTGMVSDHVGPVLVDRNGNVWLGTQSHGLMRVNSTGFTAYTDSDGLASIKTASVTRGPSGEVVVVGYPPESAIHIHETDGLVPLRIPLPPEVPRTGWGLNHVTFFDHDGKLWVPTTKGLFQFPRLDDLRDLPSSRHERRYLPTEEIYRLFEDSRGDIWMGVLGEIRLIRWERATDTLHPYNADDGIPHEAGTAFADDGTGIVWIGFYGGGLARWQNGSFEFFDHEDGVPRGMVNCLLHDHRGRLWVGANADGLGVIDDPAAPTPTWRLFSTANGLASDGIFSLAEDRFGRIYAGSLKGFDRLDPDTGRVEHFDTSTGLVNNLVLDSMTSPDGDVWFATDGGANRYRPIENPKTNPPAVFIDRVTADGVDLTVALRGVAAVPQISLPSGTDVIDIGFAAVDLTPGSRLDFEFSIDAGTQFWTSANGDRSVRLVGPAPGNHSISIRARQPDGSVGPAATVDLAIATPLWRRWWFFASVVVVIALSGWIVQRIRIRRLKELHQVRSRIAADLHDEMGLSLARVAILADVAGRSNGDTTTAETLKEIGGTARDLVDATSDMAWALDPRHDTVAALIARLRRQASEVAEGFGATFELEADPLDGVPMASEARRHLFLILKEAIRNACRHGRPDHLKLRIHRRASRLVIALEDDGIGFDTASARDGQGLPNMKRRASEMGATISVTSTPGEGTRIELDVPLKTDA